MDQEFSPTNRLPKNLLKPEWVPVKVPGILGCCCKTGRVMFEIAGVPEEVAREAMRLAMHKTPDQM